MRCSLPVLPTAVLLLATVSWGQFKLAAPDVQAGDSFGRSIAISGDVAIVGAPDDDDGCPPLFPACGTGSAYVFRLIGTEWVLEQKLTASDAAPQDAFGRIVAIHGNVAVISAPARRTVPGGSAYVFRYDGAIWVEEQILAANLISDVAIYEDRILIGNEFSSPWLRGSAAFYRHDGNTWVLEANVEPSDTMDNDRFGDVVTLSRDTALIAAPGPTQAGSVYAFGFDGTAWVEEQKLTASDAASWDRFGYSVDLEENAAIIGAAMNDDVCPEDVVCDSGSAYLFRRDGSRWIEEQKITASDAERGDYFGAAVAMGDEWVIVGASRSDDACPEDPACNSGSAYLFRYDGSIWDEAQKFVPPNPQPSDWFGYAVSMDHDSIAIGAYGREIGGTSYVLSSKVPCCGDGTVYTGVGEAANVLSINGSFGDFHRTVRVGVEEPIDVALSTSPAGPDHATYVLWIWLGSPETCLDLTTATEIIGCTVNPIPVHVGFSPQPFRCIRGEEISPRACGGVHEVAGHPQAPWLITAPAGSPIPATLTLQGVVEDFFSANSYVVSVTNAVIVEVE